jgi:hypothetical protein
MFGWGRTQAKTLDDEFATTGKIHGPLHGVPVSPTVNYSLSAALKKKLYIGQYEGTM